jgi:hypothetical protein
MVLEAREGEWDSGLDRDLSGARKGGLDQWDQRGYGAKDMREQTPASGGRLCAEGFGARYRTITIGTRSARPSTSNRAT